MAVPESRAAFACRSGLWPLLRKWDGCPTGCPAGRRDPRASAAPSGGRRAASPEVHWPFGGHFEHAEALKKGANVVPLRIPRHSLRENPQHGRASGGDAHVSREDCERAIGWTRTLSEGVARTHSPRELARPFRRTREKPLPHTRTAREPADDPPISRENCVRTTHEPTERASRITSETRPRLARYPQGAHGTGILSRTERERAWIPWIAFS